jgi:hypothetical protein
MTGDMDPTTADLAVRAGAAALDIAKQEAEKFLSAVLGEPATAFGSLFAEKINFRRFRNLVNRVVEAKRMLAEAGLSERDVPLSIIHPLLEAASLEEDPDLQKPWANLIANAADPRQVNAVLPSFPTMLKELTYREARFLNSLYKESSKPSFYTDSVEPVFTEDELKNAYAQAGLSRLPRIAPLTLGTVQEGGEDLKADLKDFATTLAVTIRLGFLRLLVETEPLDVSSLAHGRNAPRRLDVYTSEQYIFTEFARRFLRACSPLQKS